MNNELSRLTFIQNAGKTSGGAKLALYACSCGNTKICRVYSVSKGATKSCGCLRMEMLRSMATKLKHTTHGKSKSSEYTTWSGLKARCLNTNDKDYSKYGGRGITVCARWLENFENFLADMGDKPSPKYSLDRVDNDGPYSPENCRWATIQEQNANRRIHMIYANELSDLKLRLKKYEELYGPLA